MHTRARVHLLVFVLLTSALCVVTIVIAPSALADCTWIYHVDQDPELVCTYSPVYFTVLTSEPNWCDYPEGAGAYVRFNPNIENAPITGWYVVPPGDLTSAPPSGFYSFRLWVYDNQSLGCGVSWFG